MNWVKSPDRLAGLTLFIVSFLFFYDLFGERYLLTERDLAPYFIPPRFFWVESLKQGDFPLWNPYQFTGSPFFANPQNGVLYPLHSLFFLFPFDIAFNGIVIVHFFLGGFFTYLFVRDLKGSPTGALISGFTFMLGGYLLSVHSLLTILLSVIWTPLIMLFFRRAMIRPWIGNEILTGVLITLSFLGGGIEIVYGNFFVLLITMFFSMSSRQSNVKNSTHRYLLILRSFLIISFSFLLLSAIQFIPFIELWMHSIRGQGITYQEATVWSFAPKDLLLFFLPDAYGYFLDMKKYWVTQCWLKTMYTGGLPFILSLIFFLFPHPDPLPEGEGNKRRAFPEGEGNKRGAFPEEEGIRRNSLPEGEGARGNPLSYGGEGRVRGIERGRMLFLSLMLFSLFLSLGQYNPLYSLVYQYLPFFNGIRYPVKFLYIFILCLAITAGLGFERFKQFSRERDGSRLRHLLMAFALLSGCSLLFLVVGHGKVEQFLKMREIDFPDFNHLSTNLYHAKRFFFYLALFFLMLRVGYEMKWRGWTKILLVFFLVTDLLGNMGFYGKERSEDYFKKTEILERMTSDPGRLRSFSTAKTIAFDTPVLIGHAKSLDFLKERHLPSLHMIYRVHDIWGIDVVRLKRNDDLYKAMISLPSIASSHLVDLYGIKYVISVTPIEDPRFELVYARIEGLEGRKEDLLKENTIKLYQNKSPLSRAWLVRDFQIMDALAVRSTLTSKEFEPNKMVLLEEVPPTLTLPLKERGKGEVAFLSASNNRLSLRVETETESLLVLNDSHYPGWRAFVNGEEKKILRANYHFRAVVLPKGTHKIEFLYSPFSLKLGGALTFLGILGCLSGWMVQRHYRI